MSRPKGSKNKKVRSDKGKPRKKATPNQELVISPIDDKLYIVEEDEEPLEILSGNTQCYCTLCGYPPSEKPSVVYNINKVKKQGIEKRIRILVKKARSFWLETNALGEYLKYFVDDGGWVTEVGTKGTIAHVKNILPFFDGPNPIWGDIKRTYVKRQVSRGLHVKGRT